MLHLSSCIHMQVKVCTSRLRMLLDMQVTPSPILIFSAACIILLTSLKSTMTTLVSGLFAQAHRGIVDQTEAHFYLLNALLGSLINSRALYFLIICRLSSVNRLKMQKCEVKSMFFSKITKLFHSCLKRDLLLQMRVLM